jgi:hypothetical protein
MTPAQRAHGPSSFRVWSDRERFDRHALQPVTANADQEP